MVDASDSWHEDNIWPPTGVDVEYFTRLSDCFLVWAGDFGVLGGRARVGHEWSVLLLEECDG